MVSAHVIGSGPNGLAAAITLAQAGVSVTVHERRGLIGGACSSAELTLPGFRHDLGASAFPMGAASPFFQSLSLSKYGFEWIQPLAPLAHPLDDGTAVVLERSLDATTGNLDRIDRHAYSRFFGPLVRKWTELGDDILGPIVHLPRHPVVLARFGVPALLPAYVLSKSLFKGVRARALFAGNAAHSFLPLMSPISSAAGIVFHVLGHAVGWPLSRGGSQALTDALAAILRELGGRIIRNDPVETLAEFEPHAITMADITPRQLAQLGSSNLSQRWRRRLEAFRYGPGIFKIDYALSEPIPWRAKDCARAGTVHLGGTIEEISAAENAVSQGKAPDFPFVLVVQPTLFDSSRAPAGKHTAWAYCHVPNGSTVDMTAAIERQINRFAIDFPSTVLARHTSNTSQLESWNSNLIGGDISGGRMNALQTAFRPTPWIYRTGNPDLYICSSSTPPGGGVHGMCGHLAALEAISTRHKRE